MPPPRDMVVTATNVKGQYGYCNCNGHDTFHNGLALGLGLAVKTSHNVSMMG